MQGTPQAALMILPSVNLFSWMVVADVVTAIDKPCYHRIAKLRSYRQPNDCRTSRRTVYRGTASEPPRLRRSLPPLHPKTATKQGSPRESTTGFAKHFAGCRNRRLNKFGLPLDTDTTQIVFCAKPTYKTRIPLRIRTHSLAPAKCLLDSGAALNLINTNVIYLEWTSSGN